MKIKDLKQPYKALALLRQKEQGRKHSEDVMLKNGLHSFLFSDTKEGHEFWEAITYNNYPPIPPDSLNDIPLQVRWDSGERFVYKEDKTILTELLTFPSGKIACVYSDNLGVVYSDEYNFFLGNEPITEPQTRWVNVYVGDKLAVASIGCDKKEDACYSFQQQLINKKWVNV